jgi:hypothetical protein
MLRVFVITSPLYQWALRPFSYLFNVYWSAQQSVVAMTFDYPPFPLPHNFLLHRVATRDVSQHSWSTALIEFLNAVPDEHFVLLLEDYLLVRTVDHKGILTLWDYMRANPDVLRVDLTADVLNVNGDSRNAPFVGYYGHYDLYEKPPGSAYRMSLQAGIWNKRLMLEVLEAGKSSWETEVHLSPPDWMKIVGTHQVPLRYANLVYKGEIDPLELDKIPPEHRETVASLVPKDWRAPNRG